MTSARMALLALVVATLALSVGCNDGADGLPGLPGPQGEQGPPGDPGEIDNGTAVEGCIGCHGPGAVAPVADITDPSDVHYIDTDPDGPQTPSGYRQLNVDITQVDVTGSSVVIDFTVTDELGGTVPDIFAGDGRFTIAQLQPGAAPGDSSFWTSLIRTSSSNQGTGERFTTGGGAFQYLGASNYRYTSSFDPTSVPVVAGATYRVAIQLSAGDLPAGNGWCDFDANLAMANDCSSPVTLTRDIVQTATCNSCHGVTSDTKLALHGGGRTEVEYCVTCHDPATIDPDTGNTVDFKVMVHKVHYGANLANGYTIIGFGGSVHDYSTVEFTKDIDNCTNCHTGGGADVDSWHMVPTREACGSCHDDVNFDTGANHGQGGVQTDNTFCTNCHPSSGPQTAADRPVQTVHRGLARIAEANLYAFVIDDVTTGPGSNQLTVTYSVTKTGQGLMDLAADPEWTASGGASRLAVIVGWPTSDYTNVGTSSTPASALSINALNVGGAVTDNMDGTYTVVASLPSAASGTVTVGLEGHPAADLDGDGIYSDRIAVRNAYDSIDIEGGRSMTVFRRDVVDVNKCNQCHDAAGQGISLHGNNRTSEIQVCVLCHNANNTDINRRPMDPTTTPDGKKEEAIHLKTMIHKIHSGAELQNGIVVYGFGNSVHDFSHVEFIGNRQNCETCHIAGSDIYGLEQAEIALPTTIDTGADLGDPDDDLNVSPVAAACSSCHDDDAATTHMVKFGASFKALDADIHQH